MSDEVTPRQELPEHKGGRSLFGLMAVIVAVVVIVLLFLLLRGCSAAQNTGAKDTGAKVIVPVAGLTPVPGKVSVWVTPGTSVDLVLTATGLSGSNVTDMGNGRFVIAVPTGTETRAVERLKTIKGVHDAGLVYTDTNSVAPAPSAAATGSPGATATGY